MRNEDIKKRERRFYNLNSDEYLDIAIKTYLKTDEQLFEAGKSLNDVLTAKVLLGDQMENIAIGIETIKNKPDGAYMKALNAFLENNNLQKPTNIQDKIRISNYKLQLILKSIAVGSMKELDLTNRLPKEDNFGEEKEPLE